MQYFKDSKRFLQWWHEGQRRLVSGSLHSRAVKYNHIPFLILWLFPLLLYLQLLYFLVNTAFLVERSQVAVENAILIIKNGITTFMTTVVVVSSSKELIANKKNQFSQYFFYVSLRTFSPLYFEYSDFDVIVMNMVTL